MKVSEQYRSPGIHDWKALRNFGAKRRSFGLGQH
jgi:hypothetical protein